MDDELRALNSRIALHEQAAALARLGAWQCDLETEDLTWTDGVYHLFGLPVGSRVTRALALSLYEDESRAEMEAARAEAIRSGEGFTLDTRIRSASGDRRWVRLSARVDRVDGRSVRLFGAKQDITDEKNAWIRLTQRAERDSLTGLANRAVFDARYRDLVNGRLRHASVSALALIDLDNFKQINDGLGHATGDACLRRVGMRLRRIFKGAALVARIGGDEFAVLLSSPVSPRLAFEHLERALAIIRRPLFVEGRQVQLSASIGAAVVEHPRMRQTSGCFGDADAALYAAKAAGRNTVRIFGYEDGAEPESLLNEAQVA